jgi:hypothetical protein
MKQTVHGGRNPKSKTEGSRPQTGGTSLLNFLVATSDDMAGSPAMPGLFCLDFRRKGSIPIDVTLAA